MTGSGGNTEVYESADGWRWRTRSANGEIVAESGEGYVNRVHAVAMATRFGTGPVTIEGMP